MGCYNCSYLKYEDRKDGVVNGSVYYCVKIKKYVNGASDCCDSYYKDYTRKTYEKDEIYTNGRNYCNDSTSNSTYLFILVVLLLISFIVKLF